MFDALRFKDASLAGVRMRRTSSNANAGCAAK